ncbi:hypothetical protein BV20DRAFT_1049971 [Pilatotrama ljubarskyi]|nr:hypothetical protein BV20DRAFT_1049971 [Pilatotrama ljubarskyi]
MTTAPLPNVDLIYDFDRVGGETVTESTPKRSVTDTFQQMLTRTAGQVEGVGDNAIYVGTQNSAYFRVDCPEMLEFIINYFDKRSEACTIVVRPIDRNSPNTSPLRHSSSSPRSKGSPGSPQRKNEVDPFTLDSIDELVPSQVIKLSDGKVRISVDASSLVGYLQNARMDGKSAFEITVSAADQKGEMMTIDFASHELWFSCLCRGHEEAAQFRRLFMEGTKAVELHNDALQDLREDHPDLWWKVLFFARDLLRLGRDTGGPVERLDAAQSDPAQWYFFSTVYFGDGLNRILDIPGPTGPTLRATLQHVFSNPEGGVVCSSHTLFPLVQRFFRLKKEIWGQREFKRKYAEFEKAWDKQKKKNARR